MLTRAKSPPLQPLLLPDTEFAESTPHAHTHTHSFLSTSFTESASSMDLLIKRGYVSYDSIRNPEGKPQGDPGLGLWPMLGCSSSPVLIQCGT